MTTSIVFTSKLVNAAFGFVTAIIIARILGPTGRAEYFLTTTLAMGVFAVFNLGLEISIFWALSERRVAIRWLKRAVAAATAIVTVAALGAYGLLGIRAGLLSRVPSATVLAGFGLIPVSLGRWVLDGFLYASDRARIASASLVLTAGIQLAGVAAVGASGHLDSAGVLVIVTGSTLLGSFPSALGVLRLQDDEPRHTGEAVPVLRLFRVGLTAHAGTIATWLAQRADVFIVSALVIKRELGLYSLAITLSEFVLLATDAIALTALGQQRTLERAQSFQYSAAVAATAARVATVQVALLVLFGWPLIRIAYGESWVGAFPVIAAMSPGMIALAYVRPFGPAFVRAGRLVEVALLRSAAAVVNVLGTLALVPVVGIVGGGVASTIAYFTTATLFVWRARGLGITLWPSANAGVGFNLAGLRELLRRHHRRAAGDAREDTPGL